MSFPIEGDPPDVDSPAVEIADWYADNETETKVASSFAAAGGVAGVIFAASCAARMRQRGAAFLAPVAVAGGAIMAAGVGVDSALRFALADTAGSVPAESTQSLFALWDSFFWSMHVGLGILAVAVSLSALDTKLLHPVISALGVVAGVLLFVVPVEAVVIAGLIGTAVWVLITSVLFFVAARKDTPASVAAGAST